MRCAIFTNQLGPVAAEGDRLAEQRFDSPLTLPMLLRQLPLGQAPQELAARRVFSFHLRVDTHQEVVGHRDHDLGHRPSIAGIACCLLGAGNRRGVLVDDLLARIEREMDKRLQVLRGAVDEHHRLAIPP